MTDGKAVNGEKNPTKLLNYVSDNFENIFVGFGTDHDYNMLEILSSKINDSYYYVDNIENTGLVYGEIIHSILYKSLSKIVLKIENGEIKYDSPENIFYKNVKNKIQFNIVDSFILNKHGTIQT
jgi:hypothetical protein